VPSGPVPPLIPWQDLELRATSAIHGVKILGSWLMTQAVAIAVPWIQDIAAEREDVTERAEGVDKSILNDQGCSLQKARGPLVDSGDSTEGQFLCSLSRV
jgi:hypothetical protein